MGHVQDPPVSTNMISIVCMIYHMKVHMFGYNLGPKNFSKSKIHILTISEPISMKPAIVLRFYFIKRTLLEELWPHHECAMPGAKLHTKDYFMI